MQPLMMPSLTKASTQPTQDVIQGQAVKPAAALAAVCSVQAEETEGMLAPLLEE